MLLRSTFRIFGFALDTSPRKKCKRACFFLSAYSYLCPTHAGMVELVDTSDLGSDASRRGGSSPFIRTKEPFRRALFRCPFGANKCKLVVYHRFAKVSANSLNRKPKALRSKLAGARKGAEPKNGPRDGACSRIRLQCTVSLRFTS